MFKRLLGYTASTAIAATVAATTYAVPAHAGVGPAPSAATYDGRTINLAEGWAGAKACLVTPQSVRCFDNNSELVQAEAGLSAPSTAASTFPSSGAGAAPDVTACSSGLNLYSGANYTGRHIVFYDRGYWQELSNYGFADSTVSFTGGACGFHLANGTWGTGNWYPGNTGPYSFSADMGSWDDTVQSIYIE